MTACMIINRLKMWKNMLLWRRGPSSRNRFDRKLGNLRKIPGRVGLSSSGFVGVGKLMVLLR